MITPVVRELQRVSPHGMRSALPVAPARRPVIEPTVVSREGAYAAPGSTRRAGIVEQPRL